MVGENFIGPAVSAGLLMIVLFPLIAAEKEEAEKEKQSKKAPYTILCKKLKIAKAASQNEVTPRRPQKYGRKQAFRKD